MKYCIPGCKHFCRMKTTQTEYRAHCTAGTLAIALSADGSARIRDPDCPLDVESKLRNYDDAIPIDRAQRGRNQLFKS